jgi:acyl-CoA thioesterase-1
MNKLILIIPLSLLLIFGMWWWFERNTTNTQPSETEPVATEAPTYTVIAFGDSLTAGYGVAQYEAYPAILETMLRDAEYSVSVINAGVSGETSRGNLERASFIRGQNPDVVILGIGGNDALRGLPPSETEKNIMETIEVLKSGENPPQILLLRMQAPLNAGTTYKRAFDALYETIAEKKGVALVPFLTEDIFFDPENKLPDGIHYNVRGYTKVVETYLFPEVQRFLRE